MPTKLHVGNLPSNTPSSELSELFSLYGELKEVDVIKNYAFVHFLKEEYAIAAVHGLYGHKMGEKTITVEISKAVNRSNPPTKLYVSALPEEVTKEELYQLFEAYGDLEKIDVVGNVAFVYFGRKDEALLAIKDLHKSNLKGNNINVKIAEGRDTRKPRQNDRFQSGTSGFNLSNLDISAGFLGSNPILNPNPFGFLNVNPVFGSGSLLSNISSLGDGFLKPVIEDSNSDLAGHAVIYERYYISPNNPLLDGLPKPKIPHVNDLLQKQNTRVQDDVIKSQVSDHAAGISMSTDIPYHMEAPTNSYERSYGVSYSSDNNRPRSPLGRV